jgi:uncharacterized protein (TIGR03089 family)
VAAGVPTPASLLQARSTFPGPLVTFYDDATGERIELSGVTTANWVAKTANLLVDGYGLGPDARVRLLLPAHWQTVVWLLATWTVGGCVTDEPGADLAVCGVDRLPAAVDAGERIVLSLAPLGRPVTEPLPAGVLDYAREVPAFGDRFAGPPVAPGSPAWVVGPDLVTHAGLALAAVDTATAAAGGAAAGGGAPSRRLVEHDELDLGWAMAAAVVPLIGDGSVVLVRHADPARSVARRRAERAG